MTLYAESSAVLAWLLDEAEGGKVEEALLSSDLVVASELTLVECDRALLRAAALGEMTDEAVRVTASSVVLIGLPSRCSLEALRVAHRVPFAMCI